MSHNIVSAAGGQPRFFLILSLYDIPHPITGLSGSYKDTLLRTACGRSDNPSSPAWSGVHTTTRLGLSPFCATPRPPARSTPGPWAGARGEVGLGGRVELDQPAGADGVVERPPARSPAPGSW